MRKVNSRDPIWLKFGIAALDIAPLMNVKVPNEPWNHVISLWADKVHRRELAEMKKLGQLEQGTQEWHDWRRSGVTASTVGALIGVEKWGNTSQSIWAEKTQPPQHSNENEDMRRGKALEPTVRELYEQMFGWKVPPVCVIHDAYDFVRASLDGLRTDDKLVLEVKCPRIANHRKSQAIAAIIDPLERQQAFAYEFPFYRAQIAYQLLITESPVCHFVSYCVDAPGHDKIVVVELYAEPKMQETLLQRVIDFWGYVERREPPPPSWNRCEMRSPTDLSVPALAV